MVMVSPLQLAIDIIREKCIACPLCRRECAFLEKYGNPKEITDRIDPQDDASLTLAFKCSLCGLCGASAR
jgi:ferredoxin